MLTSLYHGASNSFETHPKPGGYDGVFWAADSEFIARTYIPAFGSRIGFDGPSDYELNNWARPAKNGVILTIAKTMGIPEPDADYDNRGELKSWSCKDWIRNLDVVKFLESLGYEIKPHKLAWLTENFEAGIIMPAAWRKPGQLFTTKTDLATWRLLDQRYREFDRMEPSYNKLNLFQKAEEKGFDGVIINDLTTDADGDQIGHVSYGFFAQTVKKLAFSTQTSIHQTIAEWRVASNEKRRQAA